MNKKFQLLLAGLFIIGQLVIVNSGEAIPITIVDTGEPPANLGWDIGIGGQDGVAGKFSVGDSFRLTSIGAWLRAALDDNEQPIPGTGNGTLTVSIYNDDNSSDIPGSSLYSEKFSVSSADDLSLFDVSALTWDINAGSYWVAFQVLGVDDYTGRIKGNYDNISTFNSPANPLIDEALFIPGLGGFGEVDFLDFGVIITGEPASAVVPEPMTMATLGFGLLGGFATRRKKKNFV